MHGYIYQLTTDQTDDMLLECEVYNEEMVDYVIRLDPDKAKKAIEHLKNEEWFSKLFVEDETGSIMYNGNAHQMIRSWSANIALVADSWSVYGGFSGLCKLRNALEYGEIGRTLFCLEGCNGRLSTPVDMLDWLSDLKEGTRIYIKSVFDYHY